MLNWSIWLSKVIIFNSLLFVPICFIPRLTYRLVPIGYFSLFYWTVATGCSQTWNIVTKCNIFEFSIRIDSNQQNVAIYCNISWTVATGCNHIRNIAIYGNIFTDTDSNRFESTKCCNILQYFINGCSRLQPSMKYCNILQQFADSNRFESKTKKYCNKFQ